MHCKTKKEEFLFVINAHTGIDPGPLVRKSDTRPRNQVMKGPRRCIFLLDYSNQSRWCMSVSLKGCYFEHTELAIHFESFNDECARLKEA